MNVVEVNGLGLHGANRAVVTDVSLALAPGRILGLAGPSGAGKTSLAHAVIGYLRPGLTVATGSVRVCGFDPFTASGSRAVRGSRVGYLGQDPASGLNPARRIGSQLAEALRRRPGLSDPRATVAEAAESVRLPADLLRRYPHELSGGQAQRAALAAALVGRPELLILDEPTSGLDVTLRRQVTELLCGLGAGTSVLLVSHDTEVLRHVAHDVLRMAAGRLVASAGPVAVPAPVTVPAPAVVPAPAAVSAPATVPAPAVVPAPMTVSVPAAACGSSPASRSDTLLRAAGIVAGYGRATVLDGVDLHVDPGQCVAVVGDSGSGKSTLGRCLAGLQAPWRGQIAVRGRAVPWPAGRRGADRVAVCYVPQDSRSALNPREPVAVALTRAGRAASRAGRQAADLATLLDLVGLPGLKDRYPGQLSGGERERVNLARALATCGDVLICDEVTASLDEQSERSVLDTLDRLRHELGLGIVLITHSPVVAARADATHHLAEGRLT
ncbi:ABC transporter ATP-binding protein [Micromonospora sp. AMSO31t]|uniref:ABC transporter ATP-binding protein n=1 Tax=Micromonospora sp. AMSO31t TaxID=2650566 RepID=UPI00124B315A|nr:ATP-binding cassette domain-containing protein [Micromonospora sp. AMSO31t]KAB1915621.1 ABC transporter ATP-binding protein [Micromonospora sp. AMSO31t]